jgi:predicted metal-binding membrane protein
MDTFLQSIGRPEDSASARQSESAPRATGPSPLSRWHAVLIVAEVGALTILAWLYLVRMPMSPEDLGGSIARIAAPFPPSEVHAWLTFMMWAVMMVAMMTPSASPMILTYARIASGRGGHLLWKTSMFAAGYLFLWTVFSAAATMLQTALLHAAIITNALVATPIAGGVILIAAGAYQLSPLKNACLGHCRSPISFFMTRWRDGALGAFWIGVAHGWFCVGCCWLLMALLFVVGVMNLAWVAAISAFVLLEKATRYGGTIANATGIALIIWGIVLAA